MSENIAVIGGGSWGTTLAGLLREKGHEVSLWVYEADLAGRMAKTRVNDLYLPDYTLPEGMLITPDIAEAVSGREMVLNVAPSHVTRTVLTQAAGHASEEACFVSATKGIENETLMTMDQVLQDVLPGRSQRLAFISGPSFAKEVCRKVPTAVCVASRDPAIASRVQSAFNTQYFRVYTSPDVTGVELGGSLKNVIAIASGCSDGLGFGHNTRAALITRGLAEMARLGVAMGANPLTFAGLSGLGDLVLTCTGELSRNRAVGFKLGQGMKLKAILAEMRMVAEGVKTSKAAYELSIKHKVSMPITTQVYALLYEDKDPKAVVRELMTRDLKSELE